MSRQRHGDEFGYFVMGHLAAAVLWQEFVTGSCAQCDAASSNSSSKIKSNEATTYSLPNQGTQIKENQATHINWSQVHHKSKHRRVQWTGFDSSNIRRSKILLIFFSQNKSAVSDLLRTAVRCSIHAPDNFKGTTQGTGYMYNVLTTIKEP